MAFITISHSLYLFNMQQCIINSQILLNSMFGTPSVWRSAIDRNLSFGDTMLIFFSNVIKVIWTWCDVINKQNISKCLDIKYRRTVPWTLKTGFSVSVYRLCVIYNAIMVLSLLCARVFWLGIYCSGPGNSVERRCVKLMFCRFCLGV